jgi:uncharacterized protein (TIGR03437 family)
VPDPPENSYIAKIDPTTPAVSLDALIPVSGPRQNPALSAGEVIRLTGKNLGPGAATGGIVNTSGFVTTSVAGVQVMFGNVPAPLLSVSSWAIVCVTPFELAAQTSVPVTVNYNGVQSNSVLIAVTGPALEVLGVFNEDFSVNSASNPASPGSVLSVYVSGAGQTMPPSGDGQVNQAPLAQPGMQIQVQYFIPSQAGNSGAPLFNLPVTYAGAAPGAVAGVLQVNFAAPPQNATAIIQAGNNTPAEFGVAVQ